jgi:hypothetical protein
LPIANTAVECIANRPLIIAQIASANTGVNVLLVM